MNVRAYDARVLADGPVAFWTLEGGSAGLADRTGNGHHARAINECGVTGFLRGEAATVFDGLSQYVEVPDHDDFSVMTTGVLTVEAWMRPDTLTFPASESTGYVHWMGKGSAGQYEYVSRMYSLTSTDHPPRPNRISGYAFNLSGGLGAGSYFQDTISAGEWIHYVLIINTVDVNSTYATGYTKVFKNGVKRDQDALSGYSIIPQNGSAPFRIGTQDFRSFFKGAVGRVAIYNYELTPVQILSHFRHFVAIVHGSASFVQNVGSEASDTPSAYVGIEVPAGGIAAGQFLVISVVQEYTSGAPTVADNRGNVYSVDRTSSDSGNTMRATLFSAPIHGALHAGDMIYVSFPDVVTNKIVTVDQFTGVAFSNALDRANGRQGSSITPTANMGMTTQADELLFAVVGVDAPFSEDYAEDTGSEWATLQRSGTDAVGANLTLHSAWKSVNATSNYSYAPLLDATHNWIELVASYRAGAAVVVPPPVPSITHVQRVGSVMTKNAGFGLVFTVPAPGIVAGHTLVVSVVHEYTSSAPSVVDSVGNTYTLLDTSRDAGNAVRATVFVASVNASLSAGDVIVLQIASSVGTKLMVVDEYSGVAFSSPVDQANHSTSTSTTPGVNTPIVPAQGDEVLVGTVAVMGPGTDGFTEDAVGFWSSLPRVGTASTDPGADLTLNSAYRAVAASNTYRYMPVLGTAATSVSIVGSLRAGAVNIVTPVQPTAAFVRNVGSVATSTSVTRLSLLIPSGGVPAGHTLIVNVLHEYTNAAPTMADARGNIYTCDQSSPDAGSTMRLSVFSVPVNGALSAGDRITVFFPVAVSSAVISAAEFSGITFSSPLDQKNTGTGMSTTPGLSTGITTVQGDDLLVGVVAVNGTLSDAYLNDDIGMWAHSSRAGTSSAPVSLTLDTASRAVVQTGTFYFRPTLGVSQRWIEVLASYKAGTPAVVPPTRGSATFVKNVGSTATTTSGTTLSITVPAGGVSVGHTLIVRVVADYTSGGGAMTDTRGNTYVRDRTAAATGNAFRASMFRCVVSTALQGGDVITLTLTTVNARSMSVDEFANVLTPTVIDQQNGSASTTATPSVSVTTTNANDLVVGMCAVAAPVTDAYDEDPMWLPLLRVGTSGGSASSNRTVGGGYRSVASTAQYFYKPILASASAVVLLEIAYRGA